MKLALKLDRPLKRIAKTKIIPMSSAHIPHTNI